jgi:hypothetical protein
MSFTLVSAFIHLDRKGVRSLDEYLNYGKKLLEQDVNKIIFIDDSIYETFKKYENENTKLIPTSLDKLYLYKFKNELGNIEVNSTNPSKDTFEYFCIQCNKTEWIREVIEQNYYESDQFIWIDFSIYHILNTDLKLDFLKNKKYDNLRIPSASLWKLEKHNTYVFDYKKDILWFFCGGVFGGDKTNLLKFSQLVKEKCLQLIEKDKHLMWEVNIWYLVWKENPELFDAYIADHNTTIISRY